MERFVQKSELLQAAENGLRHVGVDLKSTKPLKDENVQDTRDINTVDNSTEENEIYSLVSVSLRHLCFTSFIHLGPL